MALEEKSRKGIHYTAALPLTWLHTPLRVGGLEPPIGGSAVEVIKFG